MNHPRQKKDQIVSPQAVDVSVGPGFANSTLFSCLPLATSFGSCLMLLHGTMQGHQRWQSQHWDCTQ